MALIHTDQHYSITTVCPVLKDNLILKLVFLFDCLVDLVVHVLIIFNCLQIVHIQACYLLAQHYLADVSIALSNLSAYCYSLGPNLIKLLEVGMVFIEDAPELKID